MNDSVNPRKATWKERLKLWFRRLIIGELLARAVDNRKAIGELSIQDIRLRESILALGDSQDSQFRAFDMRLQAIGESTARALDLLAEALKELPAHIPFSWREYDCANYAVSKYERDTQASSQMTEEQLRKEILGWCRMYCHEQGWTVPPTERLVSLVESRILHGQKKLRVVPKVS